MLSMSVTTRCVALAETMQRNADHEALRALIAGLSEPAGFDSEHLGVMIGLTVVRAQSKRDRAGAVGVSMQGPQSDRPDLRQAC